MRFKIPNTTFTLWGKSLNGKGSERENCWLVGGVEGRLGWPEDGKRGSKVRSQRELGVGSYGRGLQWSRGGLSRAVKGGGKEKSDIGCISSQIICRWTPVRFEVRPRW